MMRMCQHLRQTARNRCAYWLVDVVAQDSIITLSPVTEAMEHQVLLGQDGLCPSRAVSCLMLSTNIAQCIL